MHSTNDTLKQFFLSQGVENDNYLSDFCDQWSVVNYAKNDIITREGEVERSIYFVLDGLQKSVFVNNGKEHVVAFTYPGTFSGIPDSLFSQKPAKCTLSAVTPTTLLRIHFEVFESEIQKSSTINNLFANMLKGVLVGTIERHYELQAYSMEERFLVFYKRSKHLINQLPRKDIASYLNIDPTNLSKLLSKHSRMP